MSRLIIKNLPSKVNAEKLREKFSKFGDVTDIQLKMTPDGRFRKFAFVGFKSDEQAKAALEFYDGTFFDSSKICVEVCKERGSFEKPKSWSKHSKDHLKSNPDVPKSGSDVSKKSRKAVKADKLNPEVISKVKKLAEDPSFEEFLALNPNSKVADLMSKINSDEDEPEETNPEESEDAPKLADAPISDLEYLQRKMKGGNNQAVPELTKSKPGDKSKKYDFLFTIKIKNLSAKTKKKDIKALLKPLVPASIRRTSSNSTCLAFVGFKTRKEVQQSLIKNKSFVKGRQIQICEYIDRNKERKMNAKWEEQENSLKNEETVAESGRIFIRNLPYSIKEEEIEELFSKYGPVTEVVLPLDKITRKGKGFGIVSFLMPEHAAAAFSELDGTVYQGRMLHLLPGKAKSEEEDYGSGFKEKKTAELKATAGKSYNWNTLFLGQNALVDLIADQYKADKATVLSGPEGGVRMALGETQLVANTRDFLTSNGVCLEAFDSPSVKRSKYTIIVKNLPAKTTSEEIQEKFSPFGVLKRVIIPPSGITALVEFEESAEAKAAFKKLAYSKFKNLPLYLEWAPENVFKPKDENVVDNQKKAVVEETKDMVETEEPEEETTLFVKNLNFETTEEDLRKHFQVCGKLAAVSISRKKDPAQPGKLVSMGYGFVQFYKKSDLTKALIDLQESDLQGHKLELKRSTKTLTEKPVVVRSKTNVDNQTGKKILVRNIPFQASKREVELLFKTFGELKMVRLPKKLVGTGSHRGFAFIEYITMQDAKQAMNALRHSTHLYGRRLVLEWAEEEEDVESIRKRTAQHYHPEEAKRSKKGVADFDAQEDEDE